MNLTKVCALVASNLDENRDFGTDFMNENENKKELVGFVQFSAEKVIVIWALVNWGSTLRTGVQDDPPSG